MTRQSQLDSLLAPLGAAEFIATYWGRRACSGRVPPATLAWLLREMEGGDVAKLVARQRPTVDVWMRTLDGQFRFVSVSSATDAMSFYDAGMTLFLHNGAATAAISTWLQQLAKELGHPPVPPAASLFCARRSAGTQAHFDAQENITIQLRGRKRWRVAANPSVPVPLENWALGSEVPPAMEAMLEGELPAAMPADAETFELPVGSWIYCPRGWIHEVEASEDSLSLFLGFPAAAWADLLLEAIRPWLLRLPRWRETIGDLSSPERARATRTRFEELRALLAEDLADLGTELVLPEAEQPFDELRLRRRNPLATIRRVQSGGNLTLTINWPLGKTMRTRTLVIPVVVAPLIRWLGRHRGDFSVDDVCRAHPEFTRDVIVGILVPLETAGFIVPRP